VTPFTEQPQCISYDPLPKGVENNWLGSCKAHDVGVSPEEDCGGAADEVGEGTGGEEEGSVKVGARIKPAA